MGQTSQKTGYKSSAWQASCYLSGLGLVGMLGQAGSASWVWPPLFWTGALLQGSKLGRSNNAN